MKSLTAVLLTWLVPGAGHWYIGRRSQAVFYFLVITALFLAGLAIADFRNVHAGRHPYYFWGTYIFDGGATLAAYGLTYDLPMVRPLELLDVGCLYSAVAGLLNLLIMIDVFLRASGYSVHVVDR